MIELYDIIDIICKITKKNLVLHRTITAHHKFKIYKVFSYRLFDVADHKNIILKFDIIKNITLDNVYSTWKECDKLYLEKLIKWLLSNDFKLLINGI